MYFWSSISFPEGNIFNFLRENIFNFQMLAYSQVHLLTNPFDRFISLR